MEYYTVKEIANLWNITERRVLKLCKENRLEGAVKKGKNWYIPKNIIKPLDKRSKASNYIETIKKVMIISDDDNINNLLISNLSAKGYLIQIITNGKSSSPAIKIDINLSNLNLLESKLSEAYEYLIIVDNKKLNIPNIIDIFKKYLGATSSILILTDKDYNYDFNSIWYERGINTKLLKYEGNINPIDDIDYKKLVSDILKVLECPDITNITLDLRNTFIKFENDMKTKKLQMGEYYHMLKFYIDSMKGNDIRWAISPMRCDEWNTDPLEIDFKLWCINAALEGKNIEMYFMFSKKDIVKYKNNKTINFYINSNVKTYYIDLDIIKEKNSAALKVINDGIGGINDKLVIIDLPENSKERGYASKNKNDLRKSYNVYKEVQKYAVSLKDIL